MARPLQLKLGLNRPKKNLLETFLKTDVCKKNFFIELVYEALLQLFFTHEKSKKIQKSIFV